MFNLGDGDGDDQGGSVTGNWCNYRGCTQPAGPYGLCDRHFKVSNSDTFPSHGTRYKAGMPYTASMAELFFRSITSSSAKPGELRKKIFPIVRLPFSSGPEYDLLYTPADLSKISRKNVDRYDDGEMRELHIYTRSQFEPLMVQDVLSEAIDRRSILDRPIIYLLRTNQPHTSIYVWLDGKLYSFGFGYSSYSPPIEGPIDGTEIKQGALYSIDPVLRLGAEARIIWVGILTPKILERLQSELDLVTGFEFFVDDNILDFDEGTKKVKVVDREIDFIVPSRPYGGKVADYTPRLWNCTKWAMYILFGVIPPNFREFFNHELPPEILQSIIMLLQTGNEKGFVELLTQINQPFSAISTEWAEYLQVPTGPIGWGGGR